MVKKLSLLIFEVNFSLSSDGLALETVITSPAKPQLAEIRWLKSRDPNLGLHSDADGVQNWPDCIARKLMETE